MVTFVWMLITVAGIGLAFWGIMRLAAAIFELADARRESATKPRPLSVAERYALENGWLAEAERALSDGADDNEDFEFEFVRGDNFAEGQRGPYIQVKARRAGDDNAEWLTVLWLGIDVKDEDPDEHSAWLEVNNDYVACWDLDMKSNLHFEEPSTLSVFDKAADALVSFSIDEDDDEGGDGEPDGAESNEEGPEREFGAEAQDAPEEIHIFMPAREEDPREHVPGDGRAE